GTVGVAGAAARVGTAAGAVPRALFVARTPGAAAPGRTARVVVAADRGLTGYGGTALLATVLHRDPGGRRSADHRVLGPAPVGYGLPGAATDAAWHTSLAGPGWTRSEPVRGPVLGPPLPPEPRPAAGTGARP
ncbi:MAG TPA: hypothetical protein VNU66_01430, partial [Mycobacteriales bacterium]|nr:hypothetical protein [Mycobacteriales bacterium]